MTEKGFVFEKMFSYLFDKMKAFLVIPERFSIA